MTTLTVSKSTLSGVHTATPSKSHTMRALLFALMAKGRSTISNTLPSPDTDAMIQALRIFGAKVEVEERTITVEGGLRPADNVIDAGNSGQVFRFMAAVGALLPTYTVLTGDESIRARRPISPLLNAIEGLGGFAQSGGGPIIVSGPLRSGEVSLDGRDSQPVSALLMAAAFGDGPFTINVKNPGEKPWINLTLSWLDRFGIAYENQNYETYTIEGGSQIEGFDYTVPGDFSTASYAIAAALITGSSIRVRGLDLDDVQGDKKLLTIFEKMGGCISTVDKDIAITSSGPLRGLEIDVDDIIDAVPLLAAIASFAETPTHLTNAAMARKKESDRLSCITKELRKMGAVIEERPDSLIIKPAKLRAATVESHKDHRIALALAVAGMRSGVSIEGYDCVRKSFPGSKESFLKLGADVR